MKLVTIFALLIPLAGQADVMIQIGELKITMPDGYQHIKKNGFDSAVGEIVTTDGSFLHVRFHTGDLNPIRTAPMLGAHKSALTDPLLPPRQSKRTTINLNLSRSLPPR